MGKWVAEWLAVDRFLDTILNLASCRIIRRLVSALTKERVEIRSLTMQGDDVIFGSRNLWHIRVIMHCYLVVEYEIHPMKTFISLSKGEFLRRSYEQCGILGYNSRTMLSIRLRNPILEPPIMAVERLYNRIEIWHLLGLRSANEPACATMMMEDAEEAGIAREWVARFALTPNAAEGAGENPFSRFAIPIRKAWDGRWARLTVTKDRKRIQPKMGHWVARLREKKVLLDERAEADFKIHLARTLGLRESQVYGECTYEWSIQEKFAPRFHGGSSTSVMDSEDQWDLEDVPVLVRGIFQRSLLRADSWVSRVKSSEIPELRAYMGRMSQRVFSDYLLGN